MLWSDVSSYQVPVDDSYPWSVLAIRSNDGDYRDPHFAANYAWGLRALRDGRLRILIVYFVWRPNVVTTVNTHLAMLGATHPGVVSMIDVESWGGQIGGDQSAGINQAYALLAAHWGDPRRVLGYGNRSDLDTLWPHRPPGARLVVASYGPPVSYPGMVAQQFTDGANGPVTSVAPFGRADVNRSEMSLDQLAAALGVAPKSLPGEAMMLPPFEMTGTGAKRFFTDTVGAPGQCVGREWLLLFVDGPDGATATVNVFPQYSGGGTGPERTLHAQVLTDGSHTSSSDIIGLPQGTNQAQLQWTVSAGATASLVPAFTPAGQ